VQEVDVEVAGARVTVAKPHYKVDANGADVGGPLGGVVDLFPFLGGESGESGVEVVGGVGRGVSASALGEGDGVGEGAVRGAERERVGEAGFGEPALGLCPYPLSIGLGGGGGPDGRGAAVRVPDRGAGRRGGGDKGDGRSGVVGRGCGNKGSSGSRGRASGSASQIERIGVAGVDIGEVDGGGHGAAERGVGEGSRGGPQGGPMRWGIGSRGGDTTVLGPREGKRGRNLETGGGEGDGDLLVVGSVARGSVGVGDFLVFPW
jgi:hypothetical protein